MAKPPQLICLADFEHPNCIYIDRGKWSNTSEVWDSLQELDGKVLVCHCGKPAKKCHGNTLIKLWKERFVKKAKEKSKEPEAKRRKVLLRTQENRASGIRQFPWPAIDHEWNKDTIWIDEAGMGSWAGPLHVAGTILLPGFSVQGIHDSKLLTKAEREAIYEQLIADSHILYHVEVMSNTEIDQLRLGGAWREAIRRIIAKLSEYAREKGISINRVVLDGDKGVDHTAVPVTLTKKADRLFAGVGAASILAKVSRDAFMTSIASKYPEFEEIFAHGAGYRHSEKHKHLFEQGKYTDLHRKSFNPLRTILEPPHPLIQTRSREPIEVFRL